ncbi:MAG: hypothetical protein JSW42_02700 [Chloroflexota bacterium]|nr:MAG: hypothetical protein JSW42_02700 [Chloroflexota bacterium]
MSKTDWKRLTSIELDMAESARRLGNEGRARVCARRAAGHVAGEYLHRQGVAVRNESAIERLRYLENYPDLSPEEVEIIRHFLIHTTPEHKLPIEADLIADVHLLIRQLLNDSLD